MVYRTNHLSFHLVDHPTYFEVLPFFVAVLCFSSCVNEEYDMSDVNTEITIGSESITLPLGTTKQLTLSSLMAGMNQDMLQVLEGGYAFRMGDTMSFGDQLPDMKDMLSIPDIVFEQSAVYTLSSIDQDSMSIDAQEFSYTFDVADGEFNVGATITQNRTINVTFELKKGTDVLYYTTDITLIPYTPESRDTIKTAHSGDRYDILKELYEVAEFNIGIFKSCFIQ